MSHLYCPVCREAKSTKTLTGRCPDCGTDVGGVAEAFVKGRCYRCARTHVQVNLKVARDRRTICVECDK